MNVTTHEASGTTTHERADTGTTQEAWRETSQETRVAADPDSRPLQWVRRVEQARGLDRIADRLATVADRLVASPRVRDALRGVWLGHAVHPVLTDLPLGAWTSTTMLDLFGGRRARPAAELLLAVGLVTAVPTVVTGFAEWSTTKGEQRRVGVAHALTNAVGGGCYAASLIARRRGRHALGVALALTGGAAATVSGFLGGHLSIGRKIGTSDPAYLHDGHAESS
jgi:uncharacterized membrane protein